MTTVLNASAVSDRVSCKRILISIRVWPVFPVTRIHLRISLVWVHGYPPFNVTHTAETTSLSGPETPFLMLLADQKDCFIRLFHLSHFGTGRLFHTWNTTLFSYAVTEKERLTETERTSSNLKRYFVALSGSNFWKRSWLLEPYVDWIGSEVTVKKCTYDDLESTKTDVILIWRLYLLGIEPGASNA